MAALSKRCGACHTGTHKDRKGKPTQTLVFGGRAARSLEIYQNIDRPQKSLLLRAPLAREAGGLSLCGEPVFKNTADPLYQLVLKALNTAHAQLQQDKRFDMPGFRPNRHYLREMQRFGILPADLAPDTPVDPYKTDRAYWDSFYCKPVVAEVGRLRAVRTPTGNSVVNDSGAP